VSFESDPARQAVDTLARSAGSPPAPAGLRLGGRARSKGVLKRAPALGALALALVAGWRIWNSFEERPASGRVVVEHLRVGGQRVEAKVLEVPGAQALVLMLDCKGGPGAESGRPANAPAASLVTTYVTRVCPN
jgi:hypothetical protein